MIVQALDYSVHFPKQPAHTHTHTHLTHAHTHTHSRGSAEISWLIAVVLWVKPFKCKCEREVYYQNSKTPGPAVNERSLQ